MPSTVATLALRAASLFAATFPPYLINFFKYPCVISDQAFRRTFGWKHEVGAIEAVKRAVWK